MCHPEAVPGSETPDVERQEVAVPTDDGDMPALLTRPSGEAEGAVLIVSDVFGRSPFYEDLAARLSAAGFTALVPEYFFRLGPLADRQIELAQQRRARLDENRTQEDLLAAVSWLKTETGVGRVGTIGFCMGGTQVLDLAARRRDLATVCFYGFPARLPNAGPLTAPAPLEVVDDLGGPILGFWGDADHGVGMSNVESLATELTRRKVDFRHRVYPGLGHGFMAASRLDPEGPGYAESIEAWEESLQFLHHHLRE